MADGKLVLQNKNDASQRRDVKFVVVMDYIGINMGKTPMVIVFKYKGIILKREQADGC